MILVLIAMPAWWTQAVIVLAESIKKSKIQQLFLLAPGLKFPHAKENCSYTDKFPKSHVLRRATDDDKWPA